MQEDSRKYNDQRILGAFFIAISISVGLASILSEIAFINKDPLYYYAIIWFGSLGVTFGSLFYKLHNPLLSLRNRIKDSINWPASAKVLNGVCWAVPLASIVIFPSLFQYLILLGIGLGNLSTYLLMKKYSGVNSREQLVIGLISLTAIPVVVEIDVSLLISRGDIAVTLSRIFISIAYGTGGIYALVAGK